jgi:methionine-rich copper-binding protein CopC
MSFRNALLAICLLGSSLVAGCGGDEKSSFTQANIKVTREQGVQLISSAEGTANRSFSSARLSDAKGEQIMSTPAQTKADDVIIICGGCTQLDANTYLCDWCLIGVN